MTYGKALLILLVILIVAVASYFFFSMSSATPIAPTTPAASNTFNQPVDYITQSSDVESPEVFIKSFYVWYLNGLTTNQRFTSSEEFKSSITRWLANDFASQFNVIAENTNLDPVTLTQDYQSTWASNISTTLQMQTPGSAQLVVTLGSGPDLQSLAVALSEVNGAWRITNVSKFTNQGR